MGSEAAATAAAAAAAAAAELSSAAAAAALIDDVNQFHPDGAINCGEGNPFTIGQLHHEHGAASSGSVCLVWRRFGSFATLGALITKMTQLRVWPNLKDLFRSCNREHELQRDEEEEENKSSLPPPPHSNIRLPSSSLLSSRSHPHP